jgi:hypothetical protein
VGAGAYHSSRWRPKLQFKYLAVVDPYRPGFSEGVVAKTAPCPLLGLQDQASFHRIPVHVAKFFDALVLCPDIEIVEAALPDFSRRQGDEERCFRN